MLLRLKRKKDMGASEHLLPSSNATCKHEIHITTNPTREHASKQCNHGKKSRSFCAILKKPRVSTWLRKLRFEAHFAIFDRESATAVHKV